MGRQAAIGYYVSHYQGELYHYECHTIKVNDIIMSFTVWCIPFRVHCLVYTVSCTLSGV